MSTLISISLIITMSIVPSCALAYPTFFKQYQEYPQAIEKADCSICHFDKNGGGKLQQFGLDFAHAEYNFTQEMLKKYPERFTQESTEKK